MFFEHLQQSGSVVRQSCCCRLRHSADSARRQRVLYSTYRATVRACAIIQRGFYAMQERGNTQWVGQHLSYKFVSSGPKTDVSTYCTDLRRTYSQPWIIHNLEDGVA